MIIYLIKLSICWILFYALYHFLLRRFTFFFSNRIFLLAALVLGICIPIIPIETHSQYQYEITEYVYPILYEVQNVEAAITTTPEKGSNIFLLAYFFVCAILFIKLVVNLSRIFSLYAKGKKQIFDNYTLVSTNKEHLAFSFYRWIFINEEQLEQKHITSILEHEKCHVFHKHSLDILFVEILKTIFWISPPIYLFRSALEEVHEFTADNAALKHSNRKEYGHLLLEQTIAGNSIALTHTFFHSKLKSRIKMMFKKNSNKLASANYAIAAPIVFFLLIAFSGYEKEIQPEIESLFEVLQPEKDDKENPREEVVDAKLNLNIDPVEKEKNKNVNTSNNDSGCHKVRDKDFYVWLDQPAGVTECAGITVEELLSCSREKLSKFYESRKVYTPEAVAAGYQGYLAWTLVIDENGKFERATKPQNLAKKENYGLYEAGDKIIEEMMAQFTFTPGKCNNKNVKSVITFSSTYKLNENQIKQVIPTEAKDAYQHVSLNSASSRGGLGFEYRSNLKSSYEVKVYDTNMNEIHTKTGDYMYSATRDYFTVENPVNGIYTVVANQGGKEIRNTLNVTVFQN